MIYDITTFNGEQEIWEIRYNILKNFVDEFRVIEFDKTFSGKEKEKKFNQHYSKVKHYFITEEQWSRYWQLAKESANTNYGKGAEHWIREFAMKESLKDCLLDLQDDDIVMISDCDEVWNPAIDLVNMRGIVKLKLKVYTYFLNNRSTEQFWGTIRAKYRHIKSGCLNHIRNKDYYRATQQDAGWHFTSLKDRLRDKLLDSYTEETYASKQVLDNLEDNIKNNRDFLGRNFKYRIDESEWPQWLKDNKERYKHLLK